MALAGTSRGVNLKGVILYKPEVRKYGDGTPFMVTHMATKEDVVELFINMKYEEKFHQDKYVILRNCFGISSAVGTYRVTDTSSVLETVECVVSSTAVHDFWNPLRISVADALTSPKKSRVSVTGYIKNIGETVTSSNNRKRKFIEISPMKEDSEVETIKLKLWGDEKTALNIPPHGSKVIIKRVLINEYNNKRDINSTCLTEIEECEEVELFKGTVEAIDWDSPNATLLIDDNEMICDHDLLVKITSVKSLDLVNKEVEGKRKGMKIITIKMKSEKKKEKSKSN